MSAQFSRSLAPSSWIASQLSRPSYSPVVPWPPWRAGRPPAGGQQRPRWSPSPRSVSCSPPRSVPGLPAVGARPVDRRFLVVPLLLAGGRRARRGARPAPACAGVWAVLAGAAGLAAVALLALVAGLGAGAQTRGAVALAPGPRSRSCSRCSGPRASGAAPSGIPAGTARHGHRASARRRGRGPGRPGRQPRSWPTPASG